MRAHAKQIGNSKKEAIYLDDELHLKSVSIGRWNYLVVLTWHNPATGRTATAVGHSATPEAAAKWQPFPMCDEINLDPRMKNDRHHPEYYALHLEAVRSLKERGIGRSTRARRTRWGGGWPVYVVDFDVTRKVLKIER